MSRPLLALLLCLGWLFGAACDDEENLVPLDWSLNRMTRQARYTDFKEAEGFRDGKVLQHPPGGTVPRERAVGPSRFTLGIEEGGGYAQAIPIQINQGVLEAGRVRYERICGTCHGNLGDGVSEVANKMPFIKPVSFHDPSVRAFPVGRYYQVATFGYGLMPSFAYVLTPEERWAVVAYIQALQLSQNATLSELPQDLQHRFQSEVR